MPKTLEISQHQIHQEPEQFKSNRSHYSSYAVSLPNNAKYAGNSSIAESSVEGSLALTGQLQSPHWKSISNKPSNDTLSSYLLDKIQFGIIRHKIPRLFFFVAFMVLVITSASAILLGLYLGLNRIHAQAHEFRRTVDLGYSKYTGIGNDDIGVIKWLGIRYAAPPTGILRFRAPADPETDSKTYLANQHAPLCHSTPSTKLNHNSSEDCLFLDIYAPSSNPGPHPVFVFIQGGGLNGLANPNLDGTKLVTAADFNVVVVTFNYRVGLFGFLASEEIRKNGDLNVGLLDQRKVLEWTQKYIEIFGGDPHHVTLGGSSAGAGSVALHLTAYGGRNDGLFHAAASGSPSFGSKTTVEGSQYQYDTLVERVNCNATVDTLQCLRDLDVKVLAEHNQNILTVGGGGGYPVFPYTNVIDGNFTIANTYSLFYEGKFIKVPVIFGDDTNEGTIFTPTSIQNSTDMNNFLKDNFPNLNESQLVSINNYYPKAEKFANKSEYWSAAANAYGEMRYICPGIFLNSQFSKYGLSRQWNFRWDVLERQNAASGLGVTHTADLSSIWGTSQPPEKALIPTIQSYWTSFIRTYNPNSHKLDTTPVWEPFDANRMQRLRLASVSDLAMEDIGEDQQERCAWLEQQSKALSI
ncbi:Cholinesterase [Erysiphe necator]|uniref:Carboxylic ester hydrolase n=1 Tax=Uncinula necator TaxID=52586 RepID=A0A0B1P3W4_UNCNE|nr:Cholinesterase [Erysiphe necator]KHJ31631.1 putative triacylglycerol lipase [Erysiphe necator]